MSKSEKSDKWFIRIDGDKMTLQLQCVELSRQVDVVCMLAHYHLGSKKENPHCHIVLETRTIVQKQSFALRLKSVFTGITKRSDYSLKVWDGNRTMGAVSYMFHEGNDSCIVNKGFTQEEIALAIKSNESVQKVVEINKEKASNKLVDSAIEYFTDRTFTKWDVLKYMLKRCKDGENYYPGKAMITRYVEEVELRLVALDRFDSYVDSMYKQLWRD